MSDFNVRSDSVDVEQIMRQIRARIREKRGADYTEAEVQQLAKVKLEKFLDPRGVRSDLVEQFRRRDYSPSPPLPKLELQEFSIYGTHRGLLRWIRQMLQPVLKLFVNPNPLIHFVWTQAEKQAHINEQINQWMRAREQFDAKRDTLYYELLHNLVVELTRTGIEVHNLKMRVESLSSRLEFDERRARSLEGVVEYRPTGRRPQDPGPSTPAQAAEGAAQPEPRPEGPHPETRGGERRRRRRRRRRRPGQTMAEAGGPSGPHAGGGPETAPDWSDDDRSGDQSAPGRSGDEGGGDSNHDGGSSDEPHDDEASHQ